MFSVRPRRESVQLGTLTGFPDPPAMELRGKASQLPRDPSQPVDSRPASPDASGSKVVAPEGVEPTSPTFVASAPDPLERPRQGVSGLRKRACGGRPTRRP